MQNLRPRKGSPSQCRPKKIRAVQIPLLCVQKIQIAESHAMKEMTYKVKCPACKKYKQIYEEIILDILVQCCGNQEGTEIDNQCLSAFEDGCDYLTERGYLQTLNGRIYTLTKKENAKEHQMQHKTKISQIEPIEGTVIDYFEKEIPAEMKKERWKANT